MALHRECLLNSQICLTSTEISAQLNQLKNGLNTDSSSEMQDVLQHFGVKIKDHSEITLPSPKNAIQLNSGRFKAILRYSSDCIILHLQMG